MSDQEFNWRKQREKYQPDFNRETKPEPASAPAPVTVMVLTNNSNGWKKLLTILLIVVVLAGIGAGIFFWRNSRNSTLEEIAADKAQAVGLVVWTVELKNGKKFTRPVGTAWAYAENKYATNGHVAFGLRDARKNFIVSSVNSHLKELAKADNFQSVEDMLKSLGAEKAAALQKALLNQVISSIDKVRADVIVNGTHRKTLPVTTIQVHRDYGSVNTSFDPDVASLTVNGKAPTYFKLAEGDDLKDIRSGLPIALLGFPMENLDKDNLNLDNPVASMQSGIVVAVTDFDYRDAGVSGNYLIRHNLPVTGGASGSPIFDQHGRVIALLYAGNVIGQVIDGQIARAPSAAMINFGVRVDLLKGLGDPVKADEFLMQ